jgi:c-di-GMP-binding flagellar brake protein YcgR
MERRRYPRVNVSFPVECEILHQKDYFYTVSKDLSMGGIRILSDKFLPKGNLVKININLINHIVGLKAKVAWCNKERITERYSVGLEFLETNEGDKKVLTSFLSSVYQA